VVCDEAGAAQVNHLHLTPAVIAVWIKATVG
jgi:hypothetical protein